MFENLLSVLLADLMGAVNTERAVSQKGPP